MPTMEIKIINYNPGFHSTHSVHKSIPINDEQAPRYTKAHFKAACEYIKRQMVEYNKQKATQRGEQLAKIKAVLRAKLDARKTELANKTCQLPGI